MDSSTRDNTYKSISWNGVSINVPLTWEAKVGGNQHLIFEQKFDTVVEIKWQTVSAAKKDKYIHRAVKQFEQITEKELFRVKLPVQFKDRLNDFLPQCFGYDKTSPHFVFLYDKNSQIFIMLQFFGANANLHTFSQIGGIRCSEGDTVAEWSIQDFRFSLPSLFLLHSYTMNPGVTSLVFKNDKTSLHIIRFAPATVRLKQQSLAEIFASLLDHKDDKNEYTSTDSHITFKQTPTILQQIIFRLRRKKPFILAKIWHDIANDRLLGIIIEDSKPIDKKMHAMICSSYEIC